MSEPEKIIIIRESVWQSVVSDSYTFAILIAAPWLNHTFCGGSGWIDATIAVCWFTMIGNRASGRIKESRKTPTEARDWLDAKYPVKP